MVERGIIASFMNLPFDEKAVHRVSAPLTADGKPAVVEITFHNGESKMFQGDALTDDILRFYTEFGSRSDT
jgi:hypothetical protein